MNTHVMKLDSRSFKLIADGKKTIELRLYDKKRSTINIEDIIIFQNREAGLELTCSVVGLLRYKNFSDLLDDCNAEIYLGLSSKAEALMKVAQFYSDEEQRNKGVLGIRINLVKK